MTETHSWSGKQCCRGCSLRLICVKLPSLEEGWTLLHCQLVDSQWDLLLVAYKYDVNHVASRGHFSVIYRASNWTWARSRQQRQCRLVGKQLEAWRWWLLALSISRLQWRHNLYRVMEGKAIQKFETTKQWEAFSSMSGWQFKIKEARGQVKGTEGDIKTGQWAGRIVIQGDSKELVQTVEVSSHLEASMEQLAGNTHSL